MQTEDTHSIPYVLEVAIAVLDKGKRGLYAGINHSPCLGNPFEGYHITWTDKKGKEREASIIEGLLEKYKIGIREPVVIVVHLICPNIVYESYGKGKIDIDPFCGDFAQALTDVCRFYPRFKRKSHWGLEGKESLARYYLRQELERRINLLKEYGTIPDSERTTLQGVYYKARNQMGGQIDMARRSFISAIRTECKILGKTREELGIFAAVRAELYFRGRVYPVSFENISSLAEKGCDIILIEKEGVCEVLESYASKKGVALVNSRGFVVDYAEELLNLSQRLQANLFIITDFDASGLLIAQKLPTIPRLGVDPEMITDLDLERQDLGEKYDTPKRHLKALPMDLQQKVREKRIEIDAVLAAVGPEKLWNYLEKQMLKLAPQRDLTRSLDLSIKLPSEISTPIAKITEFVQSVGIPKMESIRTDLAAWKEGFVNVEEKEKEIRSGIIEEIRKNKHIQELAKQLNKLANSMSKNSQKIDSK